VRDGVPIHRFDPRPVRARLLRGAQERAEIQAPHVLHLHTDNVTEDRF
jgi:hypothetical protein